MPLVDFHIPLALPEPPRDTVRRTTAHGLDWLRSFGLLHDTPRAAAYYEAMQLGWVATAYCPGAAAHDLDVMTEVMCWTWAVDDFFDGPAGQDVSLAREAERALAAVTLRPPGPAPAGSTPLTHATAGLWAHLTDGMSPAFVRRVSANWRDYFRAHVGEALARTRTEPPDLAGYLALRRASVAMHLFIDPTERVHREEVPAAFFHSPHVQRLRRLITDIVGWFNDVHSLEHECAHGDLANLVLVLEHHTGRSRDQAIAQAHRMVAAAVREYLRTADRAAAQCRRPGHDRPDACLRYLDTLGRVLAATHEWSLRTIRYRGRPTAPTDGATAALRPRYALAFEPGTGDR
ncbi:hypothetical protein GCM10010218_53380 [Streptomyces mashuensis]|uniref:Terpene synthase n=1 Tax=Streptomyces mashuensis TaxID=33904 RepID=A0A919B8L0_9ACTN|nr:terpene synthase family protein [Streptomyces mashuensis]GHF65237.1 hypothetical protein GCM10010218_53380 [Streptomyces mashuensis]